MSTDPVGRSIRHRRAALALQSLQARGEKSLPGRCWWGFAQLDKKAFSSHFQAIGQCSMSLPAPGLIRRGSECTAMIWGAGTSSWSPTPAEKVLEGTTPSLPFGGAKISAFHDSLLDFRICLNFAALPLGFPVRAVLLHTKIFQTAAAGVW